MSKYQDYLDKLGSIVSNKQAEDFYQEISGLACLRSLTGEQMASIAALMTAAVEEGFNGELTDW